MTIQDWGAIGEILGAIAVVLTLFYLAIQIRENARQVKVNSITAINQLINDGYDPIYLNEDNKKVWLTGLSNPDQLSDVEQQLFRMFMSRLMNSFETAIIQHNNSTLDADVFDRYRNTYKGLIETPGGQIWFEEVGKKFLSPDAVRMLSAGQAVSIT